MDPNANLREQLELAKRLLRDLDGRDALTGEEQDALRLADLVISLNEWLDSGGFLPYRWKMRAN